MARPRCALWCQTQAEKFYLGPEWGAAFTEEQGDADPLGRYGADMGMGEMDIRGTNVHWVLPRNQ